MKMANVNLKPPPFTLNQLATKALYQKCHSTLLQSTFSFVFRKRETLLSLFFLARAASISAYHYNTRERPQVF